MAYGILSYITRHMSYISYVYGKYALGLDAGAAPGPLARHAGAHGAQDLPEAASRDADASPIVITMK